MAIIKLKGIGLARPTVFAALFNAAAPFGLGWLSYDTRPMTKIEGAQFFPADCRIGIFEGRRLFVDLRGDEFDTSAYNEANVSGLAENVMESLLKPSQVCDRNIAKFHGYNLEKQANLTMERIEFARGRFAFGSLDVGLLFAGKRIEAIITQVMSRYRRTTEAPKKSGDILMFNVH